MSIGHYHIVIHLSKSFFLSSIEDCDLVFSGRKDVDSLYKVSKVDILLDSMKFDITLDVSQELFHCNKSRGLERIRVVHESHGVVRQISNKSFISGLRNMACFL